ncbi:hypothetical protein Tco_0534121 [Tanacetum coccineum]
MRAKPAIVWSGGNGERAAGLLGLSCPHQQPRVYFGLGYEDTTEPGPKGSSWDQGSGTSNPPPAVGTLISVAAPDKGVFTGLTGGEATNDNHAGRANGNIRSTEYQQPSQRAYGTGATTNRPDKGTGSVIHVLILNLGKSL